MADAPRFLLVRLDGLGDALACIPALAGLRQAHPDAAFGVVCSSANADVFSDLIERVHVLPDASAPREALEAELKRAGYTHALVATEEVAGYALASASGARRRAGFWHRFEKPFKSLWQFAQLTDRVYRPAAWIDRPEHEAETLYRLALPFGAHAPPPRDARTLREWVALDPGPAPLPTRDTLGVQVAGKLAADGWGPSALAQLCESALRSSELRDLALLAAPSDQGLAHSVLEHFGGDARSRARVLPPGHVPQWFAAIDSLAALLTPDTGAAHAAGMLGVPVIDLFAQPRFDQLSRQWRPWAAPARCLIKPMAGPGVSQRFGDELGIEIKLLRAQDGRA
jgi:ADP-heptose:LPS heptosyltransferase